MFENLSANKLRTFVSYARSPWTQKEAEAIWDEILWKLNLTPGELTDLSDAWAHFVIEGNSSRLDEITTSAIKRLSK
jgi:hypothetical protein